MDLYQEARNKDWNCGFALRPQYWYCNRVEGKRTPLKSHRSMWKKKSSICLYLLKKSYASFSLLNQLLWAGNLGITMACKTPPSSQLTCPSLTSSSASYKLIFWQVPGISYPCTASKKTSEMLHGAVTAEDTQEVLFCTRQRVPAPVFAHCILYISARIKFLFIPGSGMKGLMVNKILHNLWHGHHCYKVPEGLIRHSFSLKGKKHTLHVMML